MLKKSIFLNQKGQVTIFIIISIVIVVASIFVFVSMKNDISRETPFLSSEVGKIGTLIEDCIEKTGYDAIYLIGQQGGYFIPAKNSVEFYIPYYSVNGANLVPPKQRIEQEISKYINQELLFCTKNFNDFEHLSIKTGELITKTKIRENKVVINIDYALSVTLSDSTSLLKEFEVNIPSNLNIIYDTAKTIIDEYVDENSICLSCITDIAKKNDLFIETLNYDDETIIFKITDESLIKNNKPFTFKYAIK